MVHAARGTDYNYSMAFDPIEPHQGYEEQKEEEES